MRITSLKIPKDKLDQNGLDDIVMDHLQQMVLVVGKNGAGKSRLLAKVTSAVNQQVLPDEVFQMRQNIENSKQNIAHWEREIEQFRNPAVNAYWSDEQRNNKIRSREQNQLGHRQDIANIEDRLNASYIAYEGDITKRNVIHFVPKQLNLIDPQNLPQNDVRNRSTNVSNTIGIDNLHEWALSRIQDLHTQYWQATHQHSPLPSEKQNEIIAAYQSLQDVIRELINSEIGTDERTNATLFGFPIGQAQFSDGQKVLIQLAVAIHSQNLKLSETILLLDEPENHLHPAAIIDVIEKLKNVIPQGQIWIATHSISIIAHFSDEASLCYLENGKASKAGKEKTIVLESLIGDEDRVWRQSAFLEEPVTHAMNTYAAQCLLPPAVVTTGAGDPQMKQIQKALMGLPEDSIKVLDFGAGKGRLITNLIETTSDREALKNRINYVALDSDATNRAECEGQIARLYGSAENRWFPTSQELLVSHNKGSFDVVTMTNVLHEISPKDWLRYFGLAGELTELLKENGYLLLVEDQRIPVGESAHEFGFIVLDTGSLKDLCQIARSDDQIVQASERDGRLKAHLIPRNYLQRCDDNSVRKSLETHSKHAKTEIERLRGEGNKQNAKLFAFWLHQYANTKLALETP